MPPEAMFFRPHGSLDDDDVKVTGKEFLTIMRYFRRRGAFVVAAVLACIAGAAPLMMQFSMGNLLSVLSQASITNEELGDVMRQVIYVAVALNIVMPLNFGTRAYANPAFVADVRYALYETLLERDISYFDVTPTGVLVSRLSQDVTVLFQVYIDKMRGTATDVKIVTTGHFLGPATSFFELYQRSATNSLSRADELRQPLGAARGETFSWRGEREVAVGCAERHPGCRASR
jgi:ABC-type multidrug transport system fused ATPase/permease subunit